MVLWDGNNRMLTAGHCANPGSAWSTPGNSIGTMRLDSFEDGSTADAATLGGDISASDMDNWVYMRYNSHASVYSTQSTSDTIGAYICLSGQKYEYGRCGSIRLNDFTITYCTENTACDRPNINKWTLRAQRVGSYSYQFGDSGGAIWDGGTVAVGIQSGCRDTSADLNDDCDANQPVYSHVRLAFSHFYPISLYTGD
jgi:hypothetical protein